MVCPLIPLQHPCPPRVALAEQYRIMSTCRWCTPSGSEVAELLKSYAATELPSEDLIGANDDLSYCMECVVEYHKAREEAPQLHKALWKMETSRLISQLEESMRKEIEEDDELFLVEEDGDKQLIGYTGPNFESNVRVPLLEILRFPYLLLNSRVCELCIEALCKMEQVNNSFQVYDKLPGVYLLLVHPDERVRRWAILTAQSQGKVDRDDYYELEEVFTCLFKVIELGLFDNPEIYMYSELDEGKLILLPPHLYDTCNYKNYWLGICMLLTVLQEEAMDSLLLAPEKQNDFMKSILHVMEKNIEDESKNPFWPALHCFMTILDRLGSKVWGQLIDPIQAFQTITSSPSYNNEIENIRKSCNRPTKHEPDAEDEDLVSCSQAVYNFNTEKVKKDTGWKSAICPEYCPNMYEDMQSLTNILQSDIGQDMRVHNSTFLWFIPYVQSVMDLKDLGIAYIMEVIHHLCSEIKDAFSQSQCDKVTEFFVRVLVSIIELHRSKKCLHFLWVSSHKWVEIILKCALLPFQDVLSRSTSKISSTSAVCSSPTSQTSLSSVQFACIHLIRSLLREGYQLGQQANYKPYLDKFNLIIRGSTPRTLDLSRAEIQGLQTCLTQIIKSMKDKASISPNSPSEANPSCKTQAVPFIKTERIDEDDAWYGSSISSAGTAVTVQAVKKEPLDKIKKEIECDYSIPGCSSDFQTSIKQEKIDTETLRSTQEKSGKMQTGWQARLSEVMAKTSSKLKTASTDSESNISSSTGNSSKPVLKHCDVNIKKERDLVAEAESSSSESYISESSDSEENAPLKEFNQDNQNWCQQSSPDRLPVSEQLKRLSLENGSTNKFTKSGFQEKDAAVSSNLLENNMDCVMDSETDDENVPLSKVREKLLVKNGKKIDASVLSEVGQDPKLSSGSDEVTPQHDFCTIKRKVQSTKTSSTKSESSHGDIITISDDSDDGEELPSLKSVKSEKQEICQGTSDTPLLKKDQIKNEPTYPNYDEYESQCFEFETEEEIYSVWSDSQLETAKDPQKSRSSGPETKPTDDTDQGNNFDQWGYDTDYICDDVIQKAAEDAEKHFKASTSSAMFESGTTKSSCERLKSNMFYGKSSNESVSKYVKSDSKSKTTLTKDHLHKKSRKVETSTHKKPLTAKPNTSKSPLKVQESGGAIRSPRKAFPAVVPPKKTRICPDPSTTVEKLHLKKAPRKAFDLSQRSLDSLAELRNHGKSAGFVEAKRPKSKFIPPQSLSSKGNKKMFACQDLQFLRQSRPKDSEKRRLSSSADSSGQNVDAPAKDTGHKPADGSSPTKKLKTDKVRKQGPQSREFEKDVSNSSNSSPRRIADTPKEDNARMQPAALRTESASLQENNIESSTSGTVDNFSDSDDDLFLTQADPLDMDLCSQVETEISVGMPEDSYASSVVDHSSSVPQAPEVSTCKNKENSESITASGETYSTLSSPKKTDDHVFVKPGLPPSLQKPAKPSTTKVYSSGATSRTASLTKDLENLPKYPMPVKAKTPSAKPSVLPSNIQPSKIQPLVPTKAPVSLNMGSILQPLINQNNIPAQSSSNNTKITGAIGVSQAPSRDYAWLMQQVLHWNYEMFENISQFGPPSTLCDLPLLKVPLRFSGFDEYFSVFVPLMLLNTFESLAQEWSDKQPALSSHMCKLHLQNFCKENGPNRGDFQAWIRDVDLNRQQHPKEDDLVFLLVPAYPSVLPGEETDSQGPLIHHTAHVFRFTRSQSTQIFEREQYTLCDLNIRTYGDLFPYRGQQVQCVVVGSLRTTQREFRALIQLQRNPLYRPIIRPSLGDFLLTDNLACEASLSSCLKEYNTGQRSAIEKAYAMVKQHPRLPRICMIHGPPGTGKSKTIVGLLYRILMEKQSNVPDQNFNAKNKRNRVLVCAPSNAALDDLMKKIILEFKEKCRDKKNTLGNCGDINLVRLGAERTISSDVVKFSLDCQVNYRINRALHDPGILRQKDLLDRQLDELSRQRAMERCNKNMSEELDQRIARLTKERQLVANVLKEQRRRPQEVQRNIILESHVICCTLSTSGGFLLESAFRQLGQEPFSCVIVDEAGQSCEIETLIPLLHRCSKLVLVGDPQQLPPTVISLKAEDLGYGQSLMSRLCQILESSGSNSPVLQLTVQYRMHPDICLFPSNYFYNRVLKTDRATEEVRCSSDWPFQPYMVFDVSDGYETKERESFYNPQEIKLVVDLIKLIKSKKKDFSFRNIGVITPYRAQKMKIIDELRKVFGNDPKPCEVDTVDGFQGQQKDCVIVTCVRANCVQGCIGFLASRQRLNVTITRAKFSLFILGSLRTLMENKDWNHLIQDAQRRGALIKTKEQQYQNDVGKILKFKPVVQRTLSHPPSIPAQWHRDAPPHVSPCVSPTYQPFTDPNNPLRAAAPPPKRTIAHPLVDVTKLHSSSRAPSVGSGSESKYPGNVGAPTAASVLSDRLQDPRLARRQEERKRTNVPSSGLLQTSSTKQYQSRPSHHSSSAPGDKRPAPSSIKHPNSHSAYREGSHYSRDRSYRDRKGPYDSHQEAKKRKTER
ncbi:probable helicase senataxin isoform X2 [Hyperolius riggenbachi]|uniref:probable helicase senataxin isoform X2 n=1 Tax=Hyperolius riggenbachi TaxID=752182 RepID=UPI0035A2B5F3